jgi:hypothetical protein
MLPPESAGIYHTEFLQEEQTRFQAAFVFALVKRNGSAETLIDSTSSGEYASRHPAMHPQRIVRFDRFRREVIYSSSGSHPIVRSHENHREVRTGAVGTRAPLLA